MKNYVLAVAAGLSLVVAGSANAAGGDSAELELWRLDCGTIQVNELQQFSDTFNYIGKSKTLTDSCYLIRHNDTLMLWDTGLPEALLNAKFTKDAMSPRLNRTLKDQLQQINVKPDDIDMIGISHYHFDHVGQAAQFPKAKLLIGSADLAALKQTPLPFGADPTPLAPWITGSSTVDPVSGDRDVFGDGSVTMVNMPGHTPGSYSLLVRLPKTGTILLSGDVVHFSEQVANNNVPPFNVDRAQSLDSMARLNGITKDMPATLVIQHEPEHIKLLPTFPKSAR